MSEADWAVPPEWFAEETGGFLDACRQADDHLVYFVLNVGDGDTQLILLPAVDEGRTRRALVVDAATTAKLPALIEALRDAGVLRSEKRPLFPLVVGTHPHSDHLTGMPEFLRDYGDEVEQFWEPGYYHPSGAYVETMIMLEQQGGIRHLQPTSGTSCFIDKTKVTALTPGIGLRNRFDSYGVAINDASISLKVEFPAVRVATESAQDPQRAEDRVHLRLDSPWSLLLGGDAQTTAWSQATVDFPQLHRQDNAALYRELRAATGRDPLSAQIFKVPHHASKRGVNLELVERIDPRLTLVSSVGGGGRYNFPHPLAVEAVREAVEPIGSTETPRSPDYQLGIHYTGSYVRPTPRSRWRPLGSVAVLVPPGRGRSLPLWRLGDDTKEPVDPSKARLFREPSA